LPIIEKRRARREEAHARNGATVGLVEDLWEGWDGEKPEEVLSVKFSGGVAEWELGKRTPVSYQMK